MEWLDSVSLPLPNTFHTLFVDNDLFYLLFFPFLKVIGRGGEQISRLQQESGCKIQIAPGKFSWE